MWSCDKEVGKKIQGKRRVGIERFLEKTENRLPYLLSKEYSRCEKKEAMENEELSTFS